ncbi:MAG: hypothetical protein ACREC3_02395, partial [Methyloceanibacter sp.]
MKHEHLTDESRETAALHALGILGQEEAQTFAEHLKEGCLLCAEELRVVEQVVSQLGYAAPSVQPRPEVRARLFARLAQETVQAARAEQPKAGIDPDLSRFQFIRASEGRWREFSPGGSVKI